MSMSLKADYRGNIAQYIPCIDLVQQLCVGWFVIPHQWPVLDAKSVAPKSDVPHRNFLIIARLAWCS